MQPIGSKVDSDKPNIPRLPSARWVRSAYHTNIIAISTDTNMTAKVSIIGFIPIATIIGLSDAKGCINT